MADVQVAQFIEPFRFPPASRVFWKHLDDEVCQSLASDAVYRHLTPRQGIAFGLGLVELSGVFTPRRPMMTPGRITACKTIFAVVAGGADGSRYRSDVSERERLDRQLGMDAFWTLFRAAEVLASRRKTDAWPSRPNYSDSIDAPDLLVRIAGRFPGDPFRVFEGFVPPKTWDVAWETEIAKTLALTMLKERCPDRVPILADALEDGGCDDACLLRYMRDPTSPFHYRMWVLERLVLSPELVPWPAPGPPSPT